MSFESAIVMSFASGALAAVVGFLMGRSRLQPRSVPIAGSPVKVSRLESSLLLAFPREEDSPLILQGKWEFSRLFEAAFASPDHASAAEVLEWIAEHIEDDHLAVFVGRRGNEPWSGLAIVTDWESPFSPYPWCSHFYGAGRDMRNALGKAMGDWIQARGYDRLVAINRTGGSDERWIASHRHLSAGRIVGSYGEFVYGGGEPK